MASPGEMPADACKCCAGDVHSVSAVKDAEADENTEDESEAEEAEEDEDEEAEADE
jgi:hypothetical protein